MSKPAHDKTSPLTSAVNSTSALNPLDSTIPQIHQALGETRSTVAAMPSDIALITPTPPSSTSDKPLASPTPTGATTPAVTSTAPSISNPTGAITDPFATALKGAPQPTIQAAADFIKADIFKDVTALTDLARTGKATNPDVVKVIQGDLTTKIGTLGAINTLITPTPGATLLNITDATLDVQGLVDAVSGNKQATIQHFANDLETNLGLTNGATNPAQPLNFEDIRDDFKQLNAVLNATGDTVPQEVIAHQAMDILENLGINPATQKTMQA